MRLTYKVRIRLALAARGATPGLRPHLQGLRAQVGQATGRLLGGEG